MKKYKVCFIGLGSIAKRHITNLYDVCKEKNYSLTVDVVRQNVTAHCDVEISRLINNVYSMQEEIPDDYDILFITNPTKKHYESLKKYADKAKHFFIEKPVFDDVNVDLEALGMEDNSTYYVACPLRYKKVIQYVKENINIEDVLSIRCISSSYLPDWRPGIDYRNTYSARKDLGGGVAIDLIHEWDYLHYIFGPPEKVYSLFAKMSPLEIDTEDIAVYIAKYENFLMEIHLDYFGRKTRREVELYTKNDTIICDLVQNEIKWLKEGKRISFDEDRNDFQKQELRTFLDMVENKSSNTNTIEFAVETLKLTGGYTSVV